MIGTPYIAIGSVVAVLALIGGSWTAGYRYRDKLCDADRLQRELTVANATISNLTKQVKDGQRIQSEDAQRAQKAEDHARDLQSQIDAAPVNDNSCLDRDAVGRVRRIR